ncbi:AraC family transcriptional regulator [Nostoc sp. 3335mG]|nr:AraC family transcriptional regulator [Nostoc sp. 3335mG]
MKRSADLPLTIRPVVGMQDQYPAGYVDAVHSHDRAQLCYTLTGVMSFVTDDSTYVLPPNRAIWLPAGTRHQVSCREAVTFNILYLDPDLPGQPAKTRVFDITPLVRALIQEVLTFDHAYDETGREGRIVGLLLEDVARMPAIPVSAPMPLDRRLRRVCDQIVADPADQRDLDDLVRVAGMGRRTFTRAFRQETGMAFATWRQQVRLMAAISMLAQGKSVTSIAYEVGYESPSSFTAMFHRVLGVPPSHYAVEYGADANSAR